MSIIRFCQFTVFLTVIMTSSTGQVPRQRDQENVDYVLSRYIEAMGGRASLEQIQSVRLSGTISYPDGTRHNITVLKKKPNLVRIVLDTGVVRFTQAYNGNFAWFSREVGKKVFSDHMRGSQAEEFIREAPLESVLVTNNFGAVISLGPDVNVARLPCFQVISKFPDGSRIIHYIDKEAFLERRIIQYDANDTLIAEMVPSKFESVDGVMFAKQIVRIKDGKIESTLLLDQIEANVGLLDSAFSPPENLPED